MGGAQPLAVTMNEGVALCVEVDPERLARRLDTGYLDERADDLADAVARVERAAAEGRALSVGLVGNAADVFPELLAAGFRPDVVTDQTSAHDPLGGYVPSGVDPGDAPAARAEDPAGYVKPARESMARHCEAMVGFQRAGAEVFDYGNNLRGEARVAGFGDAFAYPGFVPAYIRPLFCEGKGPFRWAALSGDAADIARTDRAVLELFGDDEHLRRWLELAAERVRFQGLPARICWLGYGERHQAGLAFNDLVARGEVQAPIVIGRDHLDAGSVASPYRETEAMADGSDAIADWPILNALLNVASGASWVSVHHGGGVGIGRSIHAGVVVVADGSEEAARRVELVLTNDPGTGVMRHADAGYDQARQVAAERGDGPPRRGRPGRVMGARAPAGRPTSCSPGPGSWSPATRGWGRGRSAWSSGGRWRPPGGGSSTPAPKPVAARPGAGPRGDPGRRRRAGGAPRVRRRPHPPGVRRRAGRRVRGPAARGRLRGGAGRRGRHQPHGPRDPGRLRRRAGGGRGPRLARRSGTAPPPSRPSRATASPSTTSAAAWRCWPGWPPGPRSRWSRPSSAPTSSPRSTPATATATSTCWSTRCCRRARPWPSSWTPSATGGRSRSTESRRVLEAGARHGLAGKLHANELGSTGGAALAAELGCVSADHLLFCDDAGGQGAGRRRHGGGAAARDQLPAADRPGRPGPGAARGRGDHGPRHRLQPRHLLQRVDAAGGGAGLRARRPHPRGGGAGGHRRRRPGARARPPRRAGSPPGAACDLVVLAGRSYLDLAYHLGVNLAEAGRQGRGGGGRRRGPGRAGRAGRGRAHHALVECVPNVSEGRRPEVVDEIVAAFAVPGVLVLDRSSDPDHHRTVITLMGPGPALVEAAVAGARACARLIDLNHHRGVHPRMGALDVLPFVPFGAETRLRGGDDPDLDCAGLAERAGRRIAAEVGVPVYLYGAAARHPGWAALPAVRGRGFEALRAGTGPWRPTSAGRGCTRPPGRPPPGPGRS